MAAGMGSRYGGLKQIDPVDPYGNMIIDFSIYDAVRAGFKKVIFIIKKENEQDFRDAIGDRLSDKVEIVYVHQDLNNIPEGFQVPEGRVKPWGTGQAVYAARNLVKGPFAVINADDFYGADGFRKLAGALESDDPKAFCMCGFFLKNTLSENGSVSRGICERNPDGTLKTVVEHTKIERKNGKIVSTLEDGKTVIFTGDEIVSMNMWGFQASLFDSLETLFTEFLKAHGTELKSEFYIPFVADTLVRQGKASVQVLTSEDSWFGVTYQEDKPVVKSGLDALVKAGKYPEKLFPV